jgi:hypothetical protein
MKNFLRVVASLLFAMFALSAFADWTSLNKVFLNAKTHDEAVAKLKESEEAQDGSLDELLSDYSSATTKAVKDRTYDSIKQFLAANALSEQFATVKGAETTAKAIKQDPIYKAEKEVISANWLQKLLDRLKNMFKNDSTGPQIDAPQVPSWVGDVVRVLFYLLGVAIIGLIVYLLFKIPWSWTKGGRAKRLKRGGMLEDGEVLLSEDEYLLEADRLIAEGKFREACRALYLASLLRIDKSRIARFESTQTNWEHLRRIETSPTRPPQLEFRQATKAFDLAWYGYRVKYADDVQIFRETYISIKNLTEGMP